MLGLPSYLWRLIPGNPILLRVVETASRRNRDLIVRCSYLGLLIAILVYGLITEAGNTSGGSLTALTATSAKLFQNLSYLQLALVALLAPVFTAGAITQERDSQTYDILLSTPLTNGQIVLGTLLSRVFFVVALLVSGIPVFSITQIFGGVALAAIGMSFFIAATTALLTGALAIAIATLKVGTRRTIFTFYMLIAVYIVGGILLDRLDFFRPTLLDGTTASTSYLTAVHPFLALRTLFNEPGYLPPDVAVLPAALRSWPVGWMLSSPASFFAWGATLLSLALVVPSIMLLRRLAQSTLTPVSWVTSKLRLSRADRGRTPRTVWQNPIAWREAKTKGSAARATVLRWGFTSLSLIAAVVLLVGYARTAELKTYASQSSYDPVERLITIYSGGKAEQFRIPERLAVRVNGVEGSLEQLRGRMMVTDYQFSRDMLVKIDLADTPRLIAPDTVRQLLLGLIVVQAAVILLVVTNTAASTVTREKEDGTLDLLLSTPITSRLYVWGKLRGLVYFALPLVAVPVVTVGLFVLWDCVSAVAGVTGRWAVFPESLLVMPVTLVTLTAFAAITGMYLSLRCRTTVQAVMFSVGIVLGTCGALGACGHGMLGGRGSGELFVVAVAAFSPFTVLMAMVDPYRFGGQVFGQVDMVGPARVILTTFAVIAAAGYCGIVWSIYRAMVKNFDMTIRKTR
jgi:ABC-type transport system involved in multi-copper enzyme maturation permease subunit